MLNSIRLNKTVTIDLQNNLISGTVPRELDRFELLDIDLTGNKIEVLPQELCAMDGWMQGDVHEVGDCSAILCPGGTFNQFGRASPEVACEPCAEGPSMQFLGSTQCESLISERDILMKLYMDTGGDFWTNASWWNTEAPICSWFGVMCNAEDLQGTRGVTTINLASNSLMGTLPSEIWTLPSLHSIQLDNNNLVVSFEGISNAADTLSLLLMSYVKMSSLTGIDQATSLKEVHFVGNDLAGTCNA